MYWDTVTDSKFGISVFRSGTEKRPGRFLNQMCLSILTDPSVRESDTHKDQQPYSENGDVLPREYL